MIKTAAVMTAESVSQEREHLPWHLWWPARVLLLLLFIWWLSKPPNVSARLGRQTGPTAPPVRPPGPQAAAPKPPLTKACRASTDREEQVWTRHLWDALNTSSLRCTWREVTSEACSPSLTASFMTGSPLVTLSGVALNNIRSMTDVLASSGDRLQLPSSLKMCIFSSNKLIICSSFLCRSSGIRDKCKHTQHDTGLPAHYSTLTGTSAAHRGSPLLCSPGVSGLLPSHLGVPHPYLSPCQNTNEGLAWCSNTLQLLLSAQINVPHCSQRSNLHCWKQSSSNSFAR